MNIKNLLLGSILCVASCGALVAQPAVDTQFDIMPYPKKIEAKQRKYSLSKDFNIVIKGKADSRLYSGASRFLRRLDKRSGLFFNQHMVTENDAEANAALVISSQRPGVVKLNEDESYSLKVTANGIALDAVNDIGALRGLETLLQLLESDADGYYFPAVEVEDSPRFPWRGVMIDVARHFQPVNVIKRNIDGMAMVKMNVLHLHLCDDQGFRVESKIYPQLMEKASDGIYFTQDEIKEIIAYAAERGIRVVPELDVPGHGTSILMAFPELASTEPPKTLERYSGIFDPTLNPTLDKTYEVLGNIFTEVAGLFPDKYFHIGGDENEGHQWDGSPEIQKFMKEHDLKSNHELQAYFNNRLMKSLDEAGKITMGWDEIMQPALPKNALIQSWRGQEGLVKAAQLGYDVILSNGYYIDLMHKAEKHYLNDPLPKGVKLTAEEKSRVLGGEATMWSELVTPLSIDSRIWPRAAAVAERLWSKADVKDIKDMYHRLDVMSLELEREGLTLISSRNEILRNIANSREIEPLQVLAAVAEPMKGYTRNPGGTMYATYSPFALFADACSADATDARDFNWLVEDYLNSADSKKKSEVMTWLEKWKANHGKFEKLLLQSPVLKDIEPMSSNLSALSALAIYALEGKAASLSSEKQLEWFAKATELIEQSREQSGRTQLQVVDAMEALIKNGAAIIPANEEASIKVDGKLNDWKSALWNYAVTRTHPYWESENDTVKYAFSWDSNNLYVAFDVADAQVNAKASKKDHETIKSDDGIYFAVAKNAFSGTTWKDADFAYLVNANNTAISYHGKAKTKAVTTGSLNNDNNVDSGFVVELAVSWKELGVSPKEGLSLSIDFGVNDKSAYSGNARVYDFMGVNAFHKSSDFGKLVLFKSLNNNQASVE